MINKYNNTENKNYFYQQYCVCRLGTVDPKLKSDKRVLCTLSSIMTITFIQVFSKIQFINCIILFNTYLYFTYYKSYNSIKSKKISK